MAWNGGWASNLYTIWWKLPHIVDLIVQGEGGGEAKHNNGPLVGQVYSE